MPACTTARAELANWTRRARAGQYHGARHRGARGARHLAHGTKGARAGHAGARHPGARGEGRLAHRNQARAGHAGARAGHRAGHHCARGTHHCARGTHPARGGDVGGQTILGSGDLVIFGASAGRELLVWQASRTRANKSGGAGRDAGPALDPVASWPGEATRDECGGGGGGEGRIGATKG